MNIKAAAKSQKQNRMTVPNKSGGQRKTLRPANAPVPAGMGKDKTAYIIKLLDTVSQQLRRSETERELLWKELEETRRLLSDLEERTGKSEKSYSFIREEVEKTQQNSMTFLEQLNIIEGRASSAVDRIEDVTEENARISRKVERISQEKTRLNRKVNIIEEAVTSTREALEAKAMVLLTDKGVAGQTALPSMDADVLFNDHSDVTPAKTPEALVDEEAAMIKKRLFSGASISVLLVLGLAGVWGFSQFGPSIQLQAPQAERAYTEQEVAEQYAYDTSAMAPVSSQTQTYQPTIVEPTDFNALQREVDQKLMETGGDIDAVADTMNALEPASVDMEQVEAVEGAAAVENKVTDTAPVEKDIERVVEEQAKPETVVPSEPVKAQAPKAAEPEVVAKPVVQTKPVAKKPAAVKETAQDLASSLDTLEKRAVNKVFPSETMAPLAERVEVDTRLSGFAKEIETASLSGNPEAQHDLAALYTAGQEGVPQDFEKAVFWFKESGRENVANSRYNLGVLHQQGLGTLKNLERAIDMYRSAASLGHPEAQYNLGIAYAEGIGVPYSIDAAVHYFEKSAISGVPESAYNLGLIYENGLVGKTDNNKALFWYNLASDNNNIDAQNALGQLTAKLGLSLDEVRDIVRVEEEAIPEFKVDHVSGVAKAMPQAVAPVTAVRPSEGDIIDVRSVMPEKDDYNLIAPIQEQLMALGLYPGPADGINGPMTMDAIRSYQTMFSLSPDGKADAELVEHMMNNVNAASGQ